VSSKKNTEPISSTYEPSLFFTDSHIEISGTSTSKNSKIQGLLRKKPWLSQRMNFKGRLGQIGISCVIALMGMVLGLIFLRIPLNTQAIYYLVQHGYRGPYQGLQPIDIDLQHGIDLKKPVLVAHVLVHNFGPQNIDQANIRVTFLDASSQEEKSFLIPCCDQPLTTNMHQNLHATIAHALVSDERVKLAVD